MGILSLAAEPNWPTALLGLAVVLTPRLTALAALVLVIRSSGPADRPALLRGFAACLPHGPRSTVRLPPAPGPAGPATAQTTSGASHPEPANAAEGLV